MKALILSILLFAMVSCNITKTVNVTITKSDNVTVETRVVGSEIVEPSIDADVSIPLVP
jgi:hypothetical protein